MKSTHVNSVALHLIRRGDKSTYVSKCQKVVGRKTFKYKKTAYEIFTHRCLWEFPRDLEINSNTCRTGKPYMFTSHR